MCCLRLVDSSLLRSVGDGRLLMFETIREYGLERLEEAGEAPQTRDRHAEYFARLADSRWLELVRGDSPEWSLSTIQLEFRNLHGAIEWSLERGRTEDVLAIGSGIYPWWWILWLQPSGEALARAGARAARRNPSSAVDTHSLGVGDLAFYEGDLDAAKQANEESLAIFRDLDEPFGIAANLTQLADLALLQGDRESARRFAEESAAIRRERLGSRYLGRALASLANISVAEADYDQARELLEEAIRALERPDTREHPSDALPRVTRRSPSPARGLWKRARGVRWVAPYRPAPRRASVAGRARGNGGGLGDARRARARSAHGGCCAAHPRAARHRHFLSTPTGRFPSVSSPPGARVAR